MMRRGAQGDGGRAPTRPIVSRSPSPRRDPRPRRCARHRTLVDAAPVERAVQLAHELPARPGSHGAAADAVGDDIDRPDRADVERAVRSSFTAWHPAAGRDRELKAHASRLQDRGLGHCRSFAARVFALGRQRLARCNDAHGRSLCDKVDVSSGSLPFGRPRHIFSPSCPAETEPCGCVTPATVTPLSPWTTTVAPACDLDDVDVVARYVLVRPIDHQRLTSRAANAERQRLGGNRSGVSLHPRPCAPKAPEPLERGLAATIGVAGVVGA